MKNSTRQKLYIIFFIIVLNQHSIFSVAKQEQIMVPTEIRKGPKDENGRLIKHPALKQFEKEMKVAESENLKIPPKNDKIFRIMTYNIHFWRNPENTKDYIKEMINVIVKINPDLLILQEVTPNGGTDFNNSLSMKMLQKELKLKYFNSCNAVKHSWFGNIIASKIPFIKTGNFASKEESEGKRCVVFSQVELKNKKKLYIYGTHLEVWGGDIIRKNQIKEIVDKISKENQNQNFLITGDFNATRNTDTIKFLIDNGYKDCFTYINWKHPQITNWTGIEIDFIFLSPYWDLPIDGCYVYYSSVSDHLPIIMDVDIRFKEELDNQLKEFYSLANQLNSLSFN